METETSSTSASAPTACAKVSDVLAMRIVSPRRTFRTSRIKRPDPEIRQGGDADDQIVLFGTHLSFMSGYCIRSVASIPHRPLFVFLIESVHQRVKLRVRRQRTSHLTSAPENPPPDATAPLRRIRKSLLFLAPTIDEHQSLRSAEGSGCCAARGWLVGCQQREHRRLTKQKTETDCGVACLAMLAGISRAESEKRAHLISSERSNLELRPSK